MGGCVRGCVGAWVCSWVGGWVGGWVCSWVCGWMGGWGGVGGVCASKTQPGLPRHTHSDTRARACKVLCTLQRPKRSSPRRWAGRFGPPGRDGGQGRLGRYSNLWQPPPRGAARHRRHRAQEQVYKKPPGPSGSCRPDNAAAAAAQAQQCSSCLFACPRGLPDLLGRGQGTKSLIVWQCLVLPTMSGGDGFDSV